MLNDSGLVHANSIYCFVLSVALIACAAEKTPVKNAEDTSGAKTPSGKAVAASPAVVAPASNDNPDDDEAAVLSVVATYKESILSDKGAAAASVLSANTIEAYAKYRELALSAPKDAVEKMSPIDKLMILIIRGRVNTAALRTMNGKTLLVHALDKGWVGKQSVRGLGFGDVEVVGDKGWVDVTVGGEKTALRFELHREEGGWKLDIMAMMKATGPTLNKMFESIDPDVNKAILKILEMVPGPTAHKGDIWIPAGM